MVGEFSNLSPTEQSHVKSEAVAYRTLNYECDQELLILIQREGHETHESHVLDIPLINGFSAKQPPSLFREWIRSLNNWYSANVAEIIN